MVARQHANAGLQRRPAWSDFQQRPVYPQDRVKPSSHGPRTGHL